MEWRGGDIFNTSEIKATRVGDIALGLTERRTNL